MTISEAQRIAESAGYHNIWVMLKNHYAGDWEAFKRDYLHRTKILDAAIADIDARLESQPKANKKA